MSQQRIITCLLVSLAFFAVQETSAFPSRGEEYILRSDLKQTARQQQGYSPDDIASLQGLLEMAQTQEELASCQNCNEEEQQKAAIMRNFLQRAATMEGASEKEAQEQFIPLLAAAAPSLIDAGITYGPSIAKKIGSWFWG